MSCFQINHVKFRAIEIKTYYGYGLNLEPPCMYSYWQDCGAYAQRYYAPRVCVKHGIACVQDLQGAPPERPGELASRLNMAEIVVFTVPSTCQHRLIYAAWQKLQKKVACKHLIAMVAVRGLKFSVFLHLYKITLLPSFLFPFRPCQQLRPDSATKKSCSL